MPSHLLPPMCCFFLSHLGMVVNIDLIFSLEAAKQRDMAFPVGQYSIIYLDGKIFKASQEIISFTIRPCKASCHKVYVNMSFESGRVTLFPRADQFNNGK